MAKVWYDAKKKTYEHENGRSIPAQDVRTLPHHRKAVLAIAGVDSNADLNTPIENESQAELTYVETILGDGSDS